MQIMFGSPSLSLTFSWAAPEQGKGFHPISSISSLVSGGSPSGSSSDGEGMVDESELLGKPFELTLARQAPPLCSTFRAAQWCLYLRDERPLPCGRNDQSKHPDGDLHNLQKRR